MTNSLLSLGLDIIIAVLLAATIFYAYVLNKKLTILRGSREELRALLQQFVEASARAEASVKGMKATADSTGKALQEIMDRGQILRDEMSFMLERGDRLSSELASSISGGLPKVRRDITLAEPEEEKPFERAEAENEILRALKGLR
ncbi:MAG: DUF6468 domain-containing protein [Dongiaceae bacterium]